MLTRHSTSTFSRIQQHTFNVRRIGQTDIDLHRSRTDSYKHSITIVRIYFFLHTKKHQANIKTNFYNEL